MKKRNQGFTLVEIMIVVAIIAILAAVAIPNFVKYRRNSQAAACVSNLKQIQAAFEQAKMAGVTPSTVKELVDKYKYIKSEPKCSAGGTYELPEDDDSSPTCTIGKKLDSEDSSAWHMLDKSSATQGAGAGGTAQGS